MNDRHDPEVQSYGPLRWRRVGARGAKWSMPVAPGPPPELSKAQREEEARAEARAEARLARLHLVALSGAGVVVMGLVLAAVVVLAVLVVISHH
jgi:hypothetical protein